ncbi:CatB-related O-acetyltransferase [Paenibacillus sp. CN-4]|uniref:CatB-related O-acetyltransferase n=1 Tax=Paenibacillus nanchangensis TaxID=3348343 RepID=UPI00397B5F0A
MQVTIKVPEYSVKKQTVLTMDLSSSNNLSKTFPLLTIDKESYIVELELLDLFLSHDEQLINLQVGKYSSISWNIKALVDMNHDYKKVYQGRISGFPWKPPTYTNRKGQIIIQNDCWIGTGATIMGGVTMHNGAVVAANSVVTKDVPPYGIVAGNPARIVGYRFSSEQIDALQTIAWWNWSDEKILKNQKSLNSSVAQFIHEHIDEAKENWHALHGLEAPRVAPNLPSYLFFVDLDSEFSICEKVISEFASKFPNGGAELILYINEDTSAEILPLLHNIFEKYDNYDCVVNLLSGYSHDERIVFKSADFYITNRSLKNIHRMCIANLLDVTCISGFDSIIFKPPMA